jgi:hypothetical protein
MTYDAPVATTYMQTAIQAVKATTMASKKRKTTAEKMGVDPPRP